MMSLTLPSLPCRCRRSALAALPAFLLAAVLLAAAPPPARAAAPILAFETDPGVSPLPLAPQALAAIGGQLYFSGEDPEHGFEPFTSDGTAAGTRRLGDLCPGPCGSHPKGFTELGGAAVFFGNDGHTGALYRVESGGTAVQIARPGRVTAWARLGSALVFITDELRLFGTDGTAAGTAELASVPCPDGSCWPAEILESAGDAVYFAASGQLYRMREGEAPVSLGLFSRAGGFTALAADRVVFLGCPEDNQDCRLYVTDGTAAGTRRLPGLPEGGFPSYVKLEVLAWNGRAYFPVSFTEQNPATRPIASTDGTDAGLRIENFRSDLPSLLGVAGGRLIFDGWTEFGRSLMARDAAGATEILFGNGSDFQRIGEFADGLVYSYATTNVPGPNTRLLGYTSGLSAGTLVLGKGRGLPGGATLGGRFFFSGSAAGGMGLWRTDGTAAGTAEVMAGTEKPLASPPRPLATAGTLLLEYFDELGSGRTETWQLDPFTLAGAPLASGRVAASGEAGTFLVVDPANGGYQGNLHFFGGSGLVDLERSGFFGVGDLAADGHFFFFTDSAPSQSLWESDGTAAGTRLLASYPPQGPSCPGFCGQAGAIAVSGDHVFYYAQANGAPSRGRIAVWDRIRQENRVVFESGPSSSLWPIAVPGGRAVFLVFDAANGGRLTYWVSDGTAAGTRAFWEIPAGYTSNRPQVAGGRLHLVLRQRAAPFREELWVSDLTAEGQRQLLSAASFSQLMAAGSQVFFAADTGAGQEPGYSDGTRAGTRLFDLRPGYEGSRPGDPFLLGDGRVVFSADADGAGAELWISDGSTAGAWRLTDLNPGDDASAPSHFAQVGGRLFFQATDGTTGRELWALDLPALPPCPADKLCLRGGRFEVSVESLDGGNRRAGSRALGAGESGVFSFFSTENWELLVKVLDGCHLNESFWVYAAAATDVPYRLSVLDRWSGATRDYESAGIARPILDSAAFATCGAAPLPPAYAALPPGPAAEICPDDSAALCLGPAGRYRVRQEWRTATELGAAQPVGAGSADSGLFTFFSPGNWETLVKVLDGCAINGKIWVFAAGTTDVGWNLTVTDRESGASRSYENPLGQPSRTVADIDAFDCPRGALP